MKTHKITDALSRLLQPIFFAPALVIGALLKVTNFIRKNVRPSHKKEAAISLDNRLLQYGGYGLLKWLGVSVLTVIVGIGLSAALIGACLYPFLALAFWFKGRPVSDLKHYYARMVIPMIAFSQLGGRSDPHFYVQSTLDKEIQLKDAFGQDVFIDHELFLPQDKENIKGVILYGNNSGALYDQSRSEFRHYSEQGFAVVGFNTRGSGYSSGKLCHLSEMTEDADAIYQAVIQQFPDKQIIFRSHSLGTFALLPLAIRIHQKSEQNNTPECQRPKVFIDRGIYSIPLFVLSASWRFTGPIGVLLSLPILGILKLLGLNEHIGQSLQAIPASHLEYQSIQAKSSGSQHSTHDGFLGAASIYEHPVLKARRKAEISTEKSVDPRQKQPHRLRRKLQTSGTFGGHFVPPNEGASFSPPFTYLAESSSQNRKQTPFDDLLGCITMSPSVRP